MRPPGPCKLISGSAQLLPRCVLELSKDGDHTAPLGHVSHCWTVLVEKLFHPSILTLPFQVMPLSHYHFAVEILVPFSQ